MADWFDPSAPVGLHAQNADLERQRLMVQMLRKQALDAAPAKGKMVGRVYFNPTLAETLPGVVDAGAAAWADKNLGEATNRYNQGLDAAKQQWQSQLPMSTAARPELQGPPDAMGSPELAAQSAQPVTTPQILQHTLRGLDIPGNERAAQGYQTGALADLTREDNQQARKETLQATLAAQRQKQLDDLQYRREQLETMMGDKAATREQQAALAKMRDDTLRAIAQMNADARRDVASVVAASKSGPAPKPLPSTVMKTLTSLETQAEALDSVNSSFKPEYGGFGGAVSRISGTWNPVSSKQADEAANWWKNYENQAALVERHEKFGTALSAGEQAAWKNATIAPGMNPQTIKANLAKRAEIANTLYERQRDQHIKGGYPLVEEAFQSRAKAPAPPKVGDVVDGHRFLGGNPADPKSWSKL